MWLSGPKLVLPDQVIPVGSLRLEGERIAEVREGQVGEGIPLQGLTLVPGVVDLHADSLEPELEPRPGVQLAPEIALEIWENRALAAGITTAFVTLSFWEGLPGWRSPETASALAEQLVALRPHLALDLRIHARYEVSRPLGAAAVRRALGQGWVDLLSFMDHTPGQGQFPTLEDYVRYMARHLGQRPEEVAASLKNPSQGEVLPALAELAQQAKDRGVALASHDDDCPAKVQLMAKLGVKISEFPVALAAAQAAQKLGLLVVMGAPNALRGSSHVGNLSAVQALQAGSLGALATDYSPASALRAAFALAERQLLDLPKAVALVTHNPAQAVGLQDRGALRPGLRGDLVVLREKPFRVMGVFVAGRPVLLREGLGWQGSLGTAVGLSETG